MLHSKKIISLPIDCLTIAPKAQAPFIVSSSFQTSVFGVEKHIYQPSHLISFEVPFVYKDKSGYHVIANWAPLLMKRSSHELEIEVIVYSTRPKDIEKIAWLYAWHLYFRSIHVNNIVASAYRLSLHCPERYTRQLLSIGNTREQKAILNQYLGLGRQRARSAEMTTTRDFYRRWEKKR